MIYASKRTPVKTSGANRGDIDLGSHDPRMQKVFRIAARVAQTHCTVLILGESGTGKSVLARALHAQSALADKPFITVNCPCLSRELLESELFGHRKGSFTGASNDTWGKVAAAEGGTLFLDEIGDLPLSIQPKLLRLLQDREYERVGETQVTRANVRILAATNRDLKRALQEGKFRGDLFYRINVINIALPSLRERAADIQRHAAHMLQRITVEMGKPIRGFSPDALRALKAYAWPGNLRELHNAVEHATILCEEPWITPEDFPEEVRRPDAGAGEACIGAPLPLETIQERHIKSVIAGAKNLVAAARILKIDPATLYRKRKRMKREMSAAVIMV